MTTVSKNRQPGSTAQQKYKRRLPVGAELLDSGEVHFRVWAPSSRKVDVVIEDGLDDRYPETPFLVKLEPEQDGYFSGATTSAIAGMRYRFRLDSGEELFPDPASRFQPDGPHGPSEIIDPAGFTWTDSAWKGVSLPGHVIYEMHIGTFTREGTWHAAAALLPRIADAGFTLLEIMPVADFPGRFGWGYDCADFFAPTRLYGRPDDFRSFVNRAHELGLGVILDVVYNHQGPDGCYITRFSKDYFTDRHRTEWGPAFNYDGNGSGPVREFILSNAGYWIDEFHVDGLRLDATQSMFDGSPEHIIAAITRRVKETADGRPTLIIAENEPQDTTLVRPLDRGGYGVDAVWNDDFHHTARVALTGRMEAYYMDYRGTAQELVSAVKWGYLYQGQYYLWQGKPRGTSALGLRPESFIIFIQNHDQIANTGHGVRVHQVAGPGKIRAMTALLLLAANTPLLFQGQEFAASTPFLYFADLDPELARLVRQGRKEFLAQFPSLAAPRMQNVLADPGNQATFERCKLDHAERERNVEAFALHRDLIRLRRQDPVFSGRRKRGLDGAVLGPEALVLRYFGADGEDRLLFVNLGRDLCREPIPEPLLAPPPGRFWKMLWASEDPRYGGNGTPPFDLNGGNWRIPANSAVVLKAITEE